MAVNRHGAVYIAERDDEPGVFDATWQVENEPLPRSDLHRVDVDTAISWASRRAPIIYLRLNESEYYSAGTDNPLDREAWPGLEAARANPQPFQRRTP